MDVGLIRARAAEGGDSKETADLESAIKRQGHHATDIHIDTVGVSMTENGVQLFQLPGARRIDIDCAILRTLGIIKDYEQFSHRIWAVRAIEMNGITVVNSLMQWLAASDKLAALAFLSSNGLPVPDTVSSENFMISYNAAKEFGSVVVKPLRSSMGLGVFKLDDPDVAMHTFSYLVNLNKPIYVQRYLEKIGGGDYRVIVVGNAAIGAEYRRGKTWKSNVAQGAVARAARLNAELQELSVKAAEVLGLDYVGVDIAETKDGYVILETNPSIKWQAFREATGINPAEHIVRHLISKARR